MSDWREQTFGEFEGKFYLVGEAFGLLQPGAVPRDLALTVLERNFSEASCEEKLGSEAFWERASACDMSYPLLVVESDYLWVVDGVHRLFRARSEGWKTVKAYVLPVSELRKLKPVE